jgi:glycosyltransferase involved in cell wall biosynthesis
MFSVIIPVYNKAQYIDKCVKSVLAQTFSNFELLIINDGSTDNSLFIVKQFKDARIKIINQANTGVSIARNNGVRAALYDYITFLDADDWWHVRFLEKMILLIDDFPEAAIFGTQYFWVKNGYLISSINHEEAGFRGYFDYIKAYTHAWWMPLSSISVVIRKHAYWQLGGFKANLKFGEDFDLWIRFASNYKVAYLKEPLAYYNQDIEIDNRAIGGNHLYDPSSHFIFHLAYLRPFEEKSVTLKRLLDGLRVRSLLPYYLAGQYSVEVQAILAEVEFSNQPLFYRIVYHAPIALIKLFFSGKRIGSNLKQAALRLINE